MVECDANPVGDGKSEESVGPRTMLLGRFMFASGLVTVAGIGLVRGEFIAKWGAPPPDLASWVVMARSSDLLLLLFAAGILAPARLAAKAALGVSFLMLTWVVALHAPQLVIHPGAVARWGYLAGVITVGSGALTVRAALSTTRDFARWVLVARLLMGPALIWFGIGHLLYTSCVVVLVPAALPFKVLIVELTGCAHLGAGVAIISGKFAPHAALLEAFMLSSFVLLVDLPRYVGGVVHGPPWALGFETAMAGAVWCMASILAGKKGEVQ